MELSLGHFRDLYQSVLEFSLFGQHYRLESLIRAIEAAAAKSSRRFGESIHDDQTLTASQSGPVVLCMGLKRFPFIGYGK